MTLCIEAHTHRARAVVTWILRATAVALITVGSYLALKKVLFAIGSGQYLLMLNTWMEIGEGHSFYRGVSLCAVGGLLALLSRRIARWIIVLPHSGCPQCGYPHEATHDAPCPECGHATPAHG